MSREKHAEERNAYQREYGKENRDKLTLYTNSRRARKLEAEGSHTDEEWQELKALYNFKCLCCGQQEPDIKLTRDHVLPLTKVVLIQLITFNHYVLVVTVKRTTSTLTIANIMKTSFVHPSPCQ